MRIIFTILIIAISFAFVSADEVTVRLDRAVFIIPDQESNDEASSRIAVHFSLPEAVNNSDIIYAELHIPLDFTNADIDGDNILEIQARNITTNWTVENADWDGPWTDEGGDLDTTTFYTYTITMDGETDIFMDVTKFVRAVVEDGSDNFGLMLMPYKYDQEVFHIYQNALSEIRTSAQLRVVCK
ncbi:MAG: DNRLRE domain-containing protein [candidate division Zixibacteria bacterium]|nr:DNRLRE domain-containing protein [candidate division Zixibacteria bacterium]